MPELTTEPALVRWLMTPAVMKDFPSLEDLTNRPGVKSLLARHGYDGVPVLSSEIPYRE